MKKLIILALLCAPMWSQIAYDAVSSLDGATNSTYSWSHTTGSGANRALFVAVGLIVNNGVTVTGITYNSVALTKIRHTDGASSNRSEMWVLVNPASGTNTVAVTLSGAPSHRSMAGAISLTGVDQTTPSDANQGASGAAGGNPSLSITTVSDNSWVIDCVTDNGNDTITATAGQAARYNFITSDTSRTFGGSTKGAVTPAGATTMSWAGFNGAWTQTAVAVKLASAAPATRRRVVLIQ